MKILQELRGKIDKFNKFESEQDKEALETLKEQLGVYYIVPVSDGGLAFKFQDLMTYLDDCLLRDVYIAEEFIQRAIDENCEEAETIIKQHASKVQKNPGKYGEIEQYIKQAKERKTDKMGSYKTKGYQEKESLGLRYLPATPDAFVFDIKKARQYVNHWLEGISTAESFLVRVIVEDETVLHTISSQIDATQREQLHNLIKKTNSDDLIIAAKTSRISLSNCDEPAQLASMLEEAYNFETLDLVLSAKDWNKVFAVREIAKNPLAHLRNGEVISKIWPTLTPQIQAFCQKRFYEYGLVPMLKDSLPAYEHALKQSIETQQAKQDITFAFYYHSVRKDVKEMIKLHDEDTLKFIELLRAEIKLLDSELSGAVSERESFYRTLLNDSQIFEYVLKQCLPVVKELFNKNKLATIDIEFGTRNFRAPTKFIEPDKNDSVNVPAAILNSVTGFFAKIPSAFGTIPGKITDMVKILAPDDSDHGQSKEMNDGNSLKFDEMESDPSATHYDDFVNQHNQKKK